MIETLGAYLKKKPRNEKLLKKNKKKNTRTKNFHKFKEELAERTLRKNAKKFKKEIVVEIQSGIPE